MKRLWGIRHVRYFILAWRLDRHVRMCASIGLGFHASDSDLHCLDAVWRGTI